MPVFPAAKSGDTINGIDTHKVSNPVHPFVGQINTLNTPAFPSANVFINGVPACSIGATSISIHIPQGVPVDPSNILYFTKQFTNTKLSGVLNSYTSFATKTIADLTTTIPKPKTDNEFIKKTTGIDTNETIKEYQKILASFTVASKWAKWPVFSMVPLPYPAAQACAVAGSPTVTINGAPMAYTGALTAHSCSDIPVLPNANILGFSNVYVGLTYNDLARVEKKQDEKEEYIPKGGIHFRILDGQDQLCINLDIVVTSNGSEIFNDCLAEGELRIWNLPKADIELKIKQKEPVIPKTIKEKLKWQPGNSIYQIEHILIQSKDEENDS